MSERKEWTKLEVEQLISIYKDFNCLWDVRLKCYKDKLKRAEALKVLSDTFDTSVEEIQRKVHNLRNQFHNELKKIKRRRDRQPNDKNHVSKWPFFNNLQFIKSSLQTRLLLEDITDPPDCTKHEADPHDLEEEIIHCSIAEKSLATSKNITKGEKRKFEENDEYFKKAIGGRRGSDSYDIFGAFVADELRNIRSDSLRRKLRREIQKLILNVAEQDEQLT